MNEVEDFVKTLQSKPVAVFGLARSGLSTIKALQSAGGKTIAWDDNEKARAEAQKLGATIQQLDEKTLKSCAFLVLAPGVPLHFPEPHPVVKSARAANIEIICDLELFHRLDHGYRTIGVTGTNGKSTTTALIHHILKSSGIDCAMGGNIGYPVFDLKLPGEDGVFVFEISSYQLDLCPTYTPDIAVVLNITPDHIDRHGNMKNYIDSKAKILRGDGIAIINTDSEITLALFEQTQREKIEITIEDHFLMESIKDSNLKGLHNYQNALAAYAVCTKLGIKEDKIIAAIKSFPGLPHRQFPVRTINGVTYIDDSKATNAEAAEKALLSFDNIYWIAGGRAKDGGLKGLERLTGRVRKAFLIGEAAADFEQWMKTNNVSAQNCATLDVAVREAAKASKGQKGAVVLLSPACASFDQFTSYEERGKVFADLVGKLEESAAA